MLSSVNYLKTKTFGFALLNILMNIIYNCYRNFQPGTADKDAIRFISLFFTFSSHITVVLCFRRLLLELRSGMLRKLKNLLKPCSCNLDTISTISVGKIAEKAVCRSVFLTTKTHSLAILPTMILRSFSYKLFIVFRIN